jgi:NADPH:quinone reductase-like Zn-dependent oxidoreductase
MGITRFGAYSTHVKVTHEYLRKLPQQFTLEQGACFLGQALTAWYGLVYLGGLQPSVYRQSRLEQALGSKVVLIQSAAGGVGLWALNICKICAAFPIAVVGNESKKQFLIEKYQLVPEQVSS